MKMTIPIKPMGTVRTTRGMIQRIKYYNPSDKRALKVIEYLAYKQELSLHASVVTGGMPMKGAICLNLTFWMPMPDSWSQAKKKRMDGKPHTTKPDRDNLEKGVCDSLNKIVWKDDGQVFSGSTTKFYSYEPRIEIEIQEVA